MSDNSSSDEVEVHGQNDNPLGAIHRLWNTIEKQPDQSVEEVVLHPKLGHGLGKFGPKTMWFQWLCNIGSEGIQTQPEGQPPLTPTQMNSLNSEVIRNVQFDPVRLGGGAYGTVFKVKAEYKQTHSGSAVWLQGEFACKVIHPDTSAQKDIEQSMKDMLVLRYLRHENICNMVDYIPIPDSVSRFPVSMVCLLLELCHGDLEDLLDQGRIQAGYTEQQPWRFSEPLNKHWLRDVARGLAYLHSQGVAHADIKQANILFCLGSTQSVPKQQQEDLGQNEDEFGEFQDFTDSQDLGGFADIDLGQNNDFDQLVLSSTFKLADFGIAEIGAPWLGQEEADEIQAHQYNDISKLATVIYNCGVYGNRWDLFSFLEFCRTDVLTGNDPTHWQDLSPEMKQLMVRMTATTNRITAQQILDEDWVRNQ